MFLFCSPDLKQQYRKSPGGKFFSVDHPHTRQPLVDHGSLITDASRSQSDTPHLEGLLRSSDQTVAENPTWQHTTLARDSLCMTSAEFELETPANVWSQTNVLDRAATGIAFQVNSQG
jgi:hypothetical protein